jgi:hypothetical protein
MWDDQMSRPSRRRNIHKIREAEAAILKYDVEALPYTAPRYQAIAMQSEVKQVSTVIRVPDVEFKSNQEWLEYYRPKNVDPDKATPVAPALQKFVDEMNEASDALDTADAVIADMRGRQQGN